ncbi:zinc finger, CCHC-type containing protein [Tanacetum coccineum]
MAVAAMKHIALSFAKLEKFEEVDFRRWQKKMHFMLSSMSVVYVLTTPMPEDGGENPTVEILGRFTQHNMNMDESIKVSYIIDKLPPSWKYFKHTLKHLKEELTLIELGSHLRIEESLRAQDNDKPKGNNVAGPLVVNMVEHNNSSRYNDNKGKRKHHDTRANPNKKLKVTCWKCGKPGHLKKDCKAGNDDDVAWWVDSRATVHVCKDRCWFKTWELLNDGSTLHMGNESTALMHGRGCVDLRFSSRKVVSLLNVLHVPNIRKNLVSTSTLNNCGYKQVTESNKFVLSKHAFMSTSKLNDSILWHARLCHVHFKRMQDMSKDGLISAFDMDTKKCQTCMLNKITKKPFQNVKRETKVFELIHIDLCDLHATPSLGNKKYFVTFIDDASRFFYVYLLHSKDEALDKFKVFKTKVELQQRSLIKRFRTDKGGEYMDTLYFQSVGLSQGFWGEAMITACYLLNRVPNKRNRITPYELWTKKKLNLNYLRVWGCRAVVRLPDPKLKTLGKRGIECIFVGYAEQSKAFRFYVIEPNDLDTINSIIESMDVIFDEHRFSSVPKPSQRSLVKETEDSGGSVVSERVTDEIKEEINDEMDSIMGNNTWVLTDLPSGCRPLGCKWIFKIKLRVDVTVEKFKAKLVIQGFKQKSGINYFDTYAPVAAFLNKELEEEVYMNQPLGFILPCNENKVDLSKEFLSSRFSIKDMGEANVILGIRIKHKSNGIAISQSHYIEKVLKKFNYSDCTPVSTPPDTCEKPDIAFAVGKLSRYTINPRTQHWQAIQKVLKYLKKNIDYRLMYSGYPLVLEDYTDASWISNTEDNSSTSSWVFLLGGGAISWASKKQTCITGSTMESEFVALAAAGKEAEWLKNLLLEIPLWVKPMAPISIHCDSVAT